MIRDYRRDNTCRRRVLHRFACTVILCLGTAVSAIAEKPSLSEADIKVLFLFNFTKYVEWPEDVFDSPTAPLIIGFTGDRKLADSLRTLAANKTYKGRPIEIFNEVNVETASGCHILFLSEAGSKNTEALLAPLRSPPGLKVGESDDFTRLGGIIRFNRNDDKVRLEIKTAAVETSRLKLGAKLLGVAAVVRHSP